MRSLLAIGLMLLASACSTTTSLSTIGVSNQHQPTARELVLFENRGDESQVRCLAENIYFEARGSSRDDQIGVAQVTINRVLGGWAGDVCAVVWQRNRRGCQFSWTCDGIADRIREERAFERAQELAVAVFDGEIADNTNGATHYYNPAKARPRWRHAAYNVQPIGAHLYMNLNE